MNDQESPFGFGSSAIQQFLNAFRDDEERPERLLKKRREAFGINSNNNRIDRRIGSLIWQLMEGRSQNRGELIGKGSVIAAVVGGGAPRGEHEVATLRLLLDLVVGITGGEVDT
ncbi:hypothetical protein HPP92_004975 [Vanilla planifolia]|uniref:Uncharacterized protein n=1 Tax=Vanilla planifolia TaxID=51239 RepID=A0A835RT55_VANPL|nr:hypothetical protein HPP92_004975 [Vanilla planifolia]